MHPSGGAMTSPTFLQQVLAGKTAIQLPYCLANGTHIQVLDEGVLECQPRQASERSLDLVVSCGIHGNETAPVELVDQMITDILQGVLRVRARVLFIFGNVEALRTGVRYQHEDMNRLFCRQYQQVDDTYEARRAAMLEMHVMRFYSRHGDQPSIPRLHWDLHTAIRGSVYEKFAIAPCPANGEFSPAALARIALAGIPTILLQSKPSVTFSYFTSRHCRAESFTLELGKARPFGQNAGINLDALNALLRQLIEGELPLPTYEPGRLNLFRVSREVIKHTDKFVLHLAESVDNFTELPQGMVLAEDAGKQFVIQEANARIVFPNPRVKNGLRAGIVIVPGELEPSSIQSDR